MPEHTNTIAKVTLAGGREVYLPITSPDKPTVPGEVLERWQNIVNLATRIMKVPTGLITRLNPAALELFVVSDGETEIFKPRDSLALGGGMYCETTTGVGDTLYIPNALKDEDWRDNPSIDFNLIAYLGMPLRWPDGELFGTFCLLDEKEHEHSEDYIRLLALFRDAVETELARLLEREELRRLNLEKELSLREAHHRIKNHLNLLSSVLQINFSRGVASPEDFENFVADLSTRIQAIADLHAHLAKAGESGTRLGEFVSTVAETLVHSVADGGVALEYTGDAVEVSRETFFHTGLLVSELMTNALKHAFDGIEAPRITIALKDLGAEDFSLEFSDNGRGLPAEILQDDTDGIGMMLINDLPRQMGGSLSVSVNGGTSYRFELKKQNG